MKSLDPLLRALSPLLMINVKYEIVVHCELQQLPMFQGFGTPDEGKRHCLSQASHVVPQDEVIRETLAWLDKYLGGVWG